MGNIYQNNILENSKDIINTLISEIFELTLGFRDTDYTNIKSYDKFERDVFSLDYARFELEIVLIKLGISVDKYYDYKFEATSPNDDEYRCFANSFAAFITLWKNFSNSKLEVPEFLGEFYEESIKLLIEYLIKTKQIIESNTDSNYKNVYCSSESKIAL